MVETPILSWVQSRATRGDVGPRIRPPPPPPKHKDPLGQEGVCTTPPLQK